MVAGREKDTVSVRPDAALRESGSGDGAPWDYGAKPELSDRYRVTDPLGRGGVGVVYRGWDTELHRPVAIKFLRPDRPGADRESSRDLASRLRRESNALAALSHPNVVAVYDVVAGVDGVGIVMELIEGTNLRAWLRSEERTLQEILPIFIAAGRGLEAAHAQGLIHRDFKPANVMVGEDGRVRVLDFGLARLATGESSEGLMNPSGDGHRSSSPGSELTGEGVILGTPAYMAPEQIDGAPLDASSDQFSFCVSLFEALSGERPFPGHSLEARRNAIDIGPPSLNVGSRRLRAAVHLGLRAEPTARHPSMGHLLGVLAAELRPSRQWRAAGAVGLGGVSLAGFLFQPPAPKRDCGASSPEAVSWTGARRARVAAAFAESKSPYASNTWARTESALTTYVEVWTREHARSCESSARGSAVTACLAGVEEQFEALVEVFESPDAGVVENAIAAVRALPRPEDCGAQHGPASAEDPELVAAHAQVLALYAAGRYEAALEQGRELLAEAVARDDATHQTRALLRIGQARNKLGEYEDAADELRDAYFGAIRTGDHDIAVEAALSAGLAVGKGLRRREEGLQWVRHARNSIDRLPAPALARAEAASVEAVVLMSSGEREKALHLLAKAHQGYARLLGEDHPETVNVLNSLGVVHQELGQLELALEHHERARDLLAASLGPEHPSSSAAMHAVANTLALMERYDEALEAYAVVIASWEKTLSPTHPQVAMAHYNVGRIHQMNRNADAALEAYLHAIALLEESMGRDHVNTAMPVHNVGALYHEAGDLQKAQEYLERSLAVFEVSQVDPIYVAINRFELAKVLHERELDPERVSEFLLASATGLAGGGAFGENELKALRGWTKDNRPDLSSSVAGSPQ